MLFPQLRKNHRKVISDLTPGFVERVRSPAFGQGSNPDENDQIIPVGMKMMKHCFKPYAKSPTQINYDDKALIPRNPKTDQIIKNKLSSPQRLNKGFAVDMELTKLLRSIKNKPKISIPFRDPFILKEQRTNSNLANRLKNLQSPDSILRDSSDGEEQKDYDCLSYINSLRLYKNTITSQQTISMASPRASPILQTPGIQQSLGFFQNMIPTSSSRTVCSQYPQSFSTINNQKRSSGKMFHFGSPSGDKKPTQKNSIRLFQYSKKMTSLSVEKKEDYIEDESES